MAPIYGETEMDSVLRSEILLETARAEARIAIWGLLVALGVGLWFNFVGPIFRWTVAYGLIVCVPLLVDSILRRRGSKFLRGTVGPQPRG